MNVNSAAILWLLIGLALASLPFLTERRFGVWVRGPKPFFFRLLELLAGYGLMLLIGFALEGAVGRVHTQTWNFYAITLLLFLVLAYPAFVWRHLRRRPSGS